MINIIDKNLSKYCMNIYRELLIVMIRSSLIFSRKILINKLEISIQYLKIKFK